MEVWSTVVHFFLMCIIIFQLKQTPDTLFLVDWVLSTVVSFYGLWA